MLWSRTGGRVQKTLQEYHITDLNGLVLLARTCDRVQKTLEEYQITDLNGLVLWSGTGGRVQKTLEEYQISRPGHPSTGRVIHCLQPKLVYY